MPEKFPDDNLNIDLPEIQEGETLEDRNQKVIDEVFGNENEEKLEKESVLDDGDSQDRTEESTDNFKIHNDYRSDIGDISKFSVEEESDKSKENENREEEEGEIPEFSDHLKREFDEKGIEIDGADTPETVIGKLRNSVARERLEASMEKKTEMEEAKEKFIEKYQEYLKTRRLRESVGFSQNDNALPEELYILKKEYRYAKVVFMKDEYRKKKEELFEQMPNMRTEKDPDMERAHESALKANEKMNEEYFSAKLFNEVELSEQEDIQKAKMEALSVKERNFIMNGLSWYSKRSAASRLAMITAIVTGAMVGGGAIAATGAGVRALSGMLFGKLAGKIGESSIKRTEKETREEFESNFDVSMLFHMEGKAKDRLDKIESQKKKLLIAKTATAVAAGMLSGLALKDIDISGVLGKYAGGSGADIDNNIGTQNTESLGKNISTEEAAKEVPYQKKDWFEDSNQTISNEDAIKEYYDQTAGHDGAGVSSDEVIVQEHINTPDKLVYEVKSGDNLWKIIEKKLENQNIFNGMNEGQRTYLIDSIKDKFAAMTPDELKEMGVSSGDINQLKAGDELDLSSVFGNDRVLSDAVEKAESLSGQEVINIEANNKIIADWHRMNPDEALTAEKIDEILKGEHGAKVEMSAPFVSELDGGRADISGQEHEIEPDTFSEQERLELEKEVRENMKTELDKLYGTLTSSYEDSADWNDIKNRSVEDVMAKKEFENILEGEPKGFDSEKEVLKIQEHLKYVQEYTDVKPLENETVESYIKRAAWVDAAGRTDED